MPAGVFASSCAAQGHFVQRRPEIVSRLAPAHRLVRIAARLVYGDSTFR